MTLDTFLNDTLLEIARGTHDKRHPFRFVVFNTVTDEYPETRMVVLRRFDREAMEVDIYTDYRSNKVQQLKISGRASMLLWHPSKKLQVKLKLDTSLVGGDERKDKFNQLPVSGQHSYNTTEDPGTPKESLEESHDWRDEYNDDYFSIIRCNITQIEVLQLQGKEHLRATYKFLGQDLNEQHWLVP
jgi:hypothetical protein